MIGTAGEIRMYAGSIVPENWKLCEGQQLSKAQFQELFNVIGTTYGGMGDNFNLPDMRGRLAVEAGSISGFCSYNLGDNGGEDVVVLQNDELPTHNHNYEQEHLHNVGGHTHLVNCCSVATSNNPEEKFYANCKSEIFSYQQPNVIMAKGMIVEADLQKTRIGGSELTSNAGGSIFHNNMQPYVCINFIICTNTTS